MMALGPNLIDLVWYTTLDSATDTTVEKSKEFSINLKKRVIDLNTSGKSLGDISKQLQVQRANVQTTVSIKRMTQSGIKLSPAAERKMVKSQPITSKKEVIQFGVILNQLGGCQVLLTVTKLVCWSWCYYAWRTSQPAGPEPHRGSMGLLRWRWETVIQQHRWADGCYQSYQRDFLNLNYG